MGDNPATLANSSEGDTPSGGSLEEISGKIMVAAIIVLFLVIVFVFFLHLYARWFWSRRNNGEATHSTRRRSRRFVFAPGQGPAVALHRGLEPSVVRALPVLIFHPKDFKEGGLECAVCLSELVDGEKARLLPKCNHGFHLECIDMWFHSHSTCPLCRNTVGLDSDKESSSTSPESQLSVIEENSSSESPNFPTNVLFWGNQTLVSTRTIGLEEAEQHPSRTSLSMSPLSPTSTSPNTSQDGSLVIEIPGMLEGFSSLSPSSSRFADDEMKSPMLSPMVTRLRSFRRLLSREKRVLPCSPGSVDVEQGESGRGQSSKTSSES